MPHQHREEEKNASDKMREPLTYSRSSICCLYVFFVDVMKKCYYVHAAYKHYETFTALWSSKRTLNWTKIYKWTSPTINLSQSKINHTIIHISLSTFNNLRKISCPLYIYILEQRRVLVHSGFHSDCCRMWWLLPK